MKCKCKTCSTEFETVRKRGYCSRQCYPSILKQLNLTNRKCKSCGCDYKPRLKDQKYCNKKCNKHRWYKQPIDRYYQSKEWKSNKALFIQGFTNINGISISNKYCIECYRKQNRLNDMYAVDHIVRIKDGGTHEHSNLQSLCKHHHQSKSAQEGNRLTERNKGGRPKHNGVGWVECLA